MSTPNEPQKYRPESLPEQIRRVARENPLPSWVRWHWAPLGLLAAYVGLGVAVRLLKEDLLWHVPKELFPVLVGALYSSQIACACWAAWAPVGVIWRLPQAFAAAAVIAVLGRGGGWWLGVIFSGMIFVTFALFFASARWASGCRLVDGRQRHLAGGSKFKFNTRDLIFVTTLVAGIITLERLLMGGIEEFGDADTSFTEFFNSLSVSEFIYVIIFGSGFSLLQKVPWVFPFLCPLLPRPRWLLMLLVTPLLVVGIRYAAELSNLHVGQSINASWWPWAVLSGGASVWMMVSGVVLRLGGYRLANGKTDNA